MMETIKIKRYQSPVGELLIGAYKDRLCLCDWTASKRRDANDRRILRHLNAIYEEGSSDAISGATNQLDEYFSGRRRDFSIPLLFTGTHLQCRVWSELTNIPFGTTLTYSAIASHIGKPKAIRAVASAIASNPISIFVPCHRVIGADGSLTGYAGGLHTKQTLLTMENSDI